MHRLSNLTFNPTDLEFDLETYGQLMCNTPAPPKFIQVKQTRLERKQRSWQVVSRKQLL